MQRQSIETTQRVFEQGLDLQRSVAETALRNGFATQRSAQTWGFELAEEMAKSQFERYESLMDDLEGEFRSALDDQFQRNADVIQQRFDEQFQQSANLVRQMLNSQYEQNADFLQQLLNAQVDGAQSAFTDTFDGQSMIDSQFRAMSDSQDLLWNQFEPGVLDAVDQVTEQQRMLVSQSTDALLEATESVEKQTLNGS